MAKAGASDDTIDLPPVVRLRIAYPPMSEPGSFPSEQERAVRAALLGALLGLFLALIAAGRRRS